MDMPRKNEHEGVSGLAPASQNVNVRVLRTRLTQLREKWKTETGQLWQLGKHRLLIGDCTVHEDVGRLMGGDISVLIHADPPYGMGKESDGVENDNLYGEKLDDFQMKWWKACRPFLADNGSVYIWGRAENLWRLWYRRLKDSERLTFRNEIVWYKPGGVSGMKSNTHRQYPTATERCLFFMLGEQGFNNNASNYWEGWEGIRSYLEGEARKIGLNNKKLREICGVSSMYSHWFTKSQWTLIPEHHYLKLQAASRNAFTKDYDAFKKEYDALKKEYDALKMEFYKSRAYFDNTHDSMTDVWIFPRVAGAERWFHPAAKPVELSERVIKSSSREGDVVLIPFAGSGPDFIACERTGRLARGLEIRPDFSAAILERFHAAFPDEEIRLLE